MHTTEPINPKMLVPIDPSVQISTNEVSKLDTSFTLPCFNIALNNAKYEGLILNAQMDFCNIGVLADIGVDIDIDIDIDWFDIDVDLDFYSKLVLIGDINTKVKVNADSGAINQPKKIPLTAPFYVPVFTGVFVKGQLYLRIDPDFRASLEINFEDKFHLEEGFAYSLDDGFQKIDKTTNTATLDVKSKVDASIAAGPDFELTLTLLDMAYAGIDLYPGIRAGYYRYYEQGRCDSINVDAFLQLDVIAGYNVIVAKGKTSFHLIPPVYVPLYQLDVNCPPPNPPTNLSAKLISVNTGGQLQTGLGMNNVEIYLDWTNVQLSWDPVDKATSYNVTRTDIADGHTLKISTTDTTYIDKTARQGSTFNYQVTAVNERGLESGPSNVLQVKVLNLPPPAPQNLTAVRPDVVTLKWDKIGGLVTYNVKRAEGTSTDYVTIAPMISDATYTDTTASVLKEYNYVVTAVDGSGEGDKSNSVHVDRPIIDLIPYNPKLPLDNLTLSSPAPGNFNANRDLNSGKVVLSWNAVDGATGYNVWRSAAENGMYETIGAKVSSPTFTDTTGAIGTTYYYKVTAVNSKGAESRFTPIKSASASYGIR